MTDTNSWLAQRHTEMHSMRLEIAALEAQTDDTTAVRGAGVLGRTGYQLTPTTADTEGHGL